MNYKKHVTIAIINSPLNTDPTYDTHRTHSGIGSTLRVAAMRAVEDFQRYNKLRKGETIVIRISRVA